jgi:hypothetical protein
MKMRETKDLKFYEVEYETTHKKIVGIPNDQTINHRDLIKKHIYPFWCNWGRSGVVVKEGGYSGTISGINIKPVANKEYVIEGVLVGTVTRSVDYTIEASNEDEARRMAEEKMSEDADDMLSHSSWDDERYDDTSIWSVKEAV